MSETKSKSSKNSSKVQQVLITRGIIVFPSVTMDVQVGRPKSVLTIKDLSKDDEIILVSQKNPDLDDVTVDDIFKIGTLCKIKDIKVNLEGDYTLTLKGSKRIKLINPNFSPKSGFTTEWEELKVKPGNAKRNEIIVDNILEMISEYSDVVNKSKEIKKFYEYAMNNQKSFSSIADFVVNNLVLPFKKTQEFLECESITERLEIAYGYLVEFFDTDHSIRDEVDHQINKKMNENISKQQKEFYLRERLKTVKEELGELSSKEDEADQIRKRLNNNPYPEEIREKVLSELSKYEAAMSSNEASITKVYIDWLLDLPWWQSSEDNDDLKNVEKVLNKNHYGIEKVKERIIEYLALRTKNKSSRGPILCLVGPPGVGKTSLAKSIAEALNKKYVKVSLGGVKDEAEIRGHRKTYIGAMPGRIIKGMKKAGVINPLFLLDEIDKMANSEKGDPASAMLEVLDPEQNSKFSDNYIEEEYDLSKVMFVATANYYKQIPYALIDRLEIIELTSYTVPEKLEIAKQHLIPKALKEGLIDNLKWTDDAIKMIINNYTNEAGVRELERQIQKIVRKYIVDELKGDTLPKEITNNEIKKYLGKIIYDVTLKDQEAIPGIVNGMAYTTTGGDLLPIECTYSIGKGKVLITGNLEKTMNESVSVALGYVKANAENFNIDPKVFSEIDIHVHVPAGGIPKDGPSAGVAITSAIISAIRKVPVKTNISMTGEITLRGKVGIIGGVKEKVISAHRAGVREIFLPEDDERFLEDVPKDILKDIKIHLVKQYNEIYNHLFK